MPERAREDQQGANPHSIELSSRYILVRSNAHLWIEWFLNSRSPSFVLDVIKMVKDLESAQENMQPQQQIERRIALIKATLSEKEAK